MSQRDRPITAPDPGEPVDLRMALATARSLSHQVAVAIVALEGGLQAQAILTQAEAQVARLDQRRAELEALVESLAQREATARSRMEGAEQAARDEVARRDAEVASAVQALEAQLADAQREHAAGLVRIERERTAAVTAAQEEIDEITRQLARTREEADRLVAGLKAAR